MIAYDLKVENGTYTELTDGTPVNVEETGEEFNGIVIDGDGTSQYYEFTGKGFPIGFDFNYNGHAMNQFMIATNGYILLGKDQISSSVPFNNFFIFDNDKDTNLFGLVGQGDVTANESTKISYKLTGDAPNRELVIQYKDIEMRGFGWEPGVIAVASIQYRLYEATGNIKMTLNNFKPSEDLRLKIGILGDTGDRQMLTTFNTTKTTTEDYIIQWTTTDYPADGVSYTFVAPDPCVTPAGQPSELKLYSSTAGISGKLTLAPDADHALVLATTAAELTAMPENGKFYKVGDSIGTAVVIGTTEDGAFASGEILKAATKHNVFAMSYNSLCLDGPLYNTASPITADITTMDGTPNSVTVSNIDRNFFEFGVEAAEGMQVLVAVTNAMRMYESEFGMPAGPLSVGDTISEGDRVVYIGPSTDAIKVEGLQPGTRYFVKAWTTDGNGNYSTEGVEQGFVTAFDMPYTADFEDYPYFQIPMGWNCQGEWTIDNSWTMKCTGKEGEEMWMETPYIYLAEGMNRLFANLSLASGWSSFEFADGDYMAVQITTDGKEYKDIARFDKDNATGISNSLKQLVWTFGDYAGQKVRVRFYAKTAKAATMQVGGVSIIQKPACDYVINVKAEPDGKNAIVTWEQQGEEDAWEISFKKGADPKYGEPIEWGEPILVRERSYTMENLDSYATYSVRVRACCSKEMKSEWSETVVFKSSLYIPFNIVVADETTELQGWNAYKGKLADPTVMESSYAFNSNAGSLFFSSSSDKECNEWFVSPQLDFEAGKEYEMTVDFITGNRYTDYYTYSTDNEIRFMVAADGENFMSKDSVLVIRYDDYKDANTDYSFKAKINGYSGKVRVGLYVSSTAGVPLGFTINTISMQEAVVDGIGSINAGRTDLGTPEAVYNANGQRIDKLQKGVNIVRYANGQTRKVMVK